MEQCEQKHADLGVAFCFMFVPRCLAIPQIGHGLKVAPFLFICNLKTRLEVKMKSIMLCLFVFFLASGGAFAGEEKQYVGFGYHLGSYDEDGFPGADLNGIKIKGGKYVSDNVAVEGHFLMGVGSDTVIGVDIELDTAISIFLKGDLPLSDTARVYGLLGYTKGELTASVPGFSISEDDSGLSFGFGVDVNLAPDLLIGGEYISYIDESDYDYTGFNLTITKLL
jgi:opacity protein-like surface antigen